MSDTTPTPVPNSADGTYTRSEFAARQGWSKSYITKLGHDGRLVLTDDGKRVIESATLERIAATTGAPERAAPAVVSSALQDLQIAEKTLDVARKRREEAVQTGALRQAAEVEALIATAGAQFRAALEGLAADLPPQLVAIAGNEGAMRALLTQEFEALLGNLARNFAAAAGTAAAAPSH